MRWTIRKKILVGIGLSWLAMVIIGVVAYLATTNLRVQSTTSGLLLATLFVLGSAIAGGISLANHINKSINTLVKGIREIAAGNLDYKVPASSQDEIAELTAAFNQLAKRLQMNQSDSIKNNLLFQNLFEYSPEAILVVDRQGKIELANAQVEQVFGYPSVELQGMVIESLLPERFRERHQQHREHYLEHPRPRLMGSGIELYGRHRSGTEFPVDVVLSTLSKPDTYLVLAVVRDITGRKQAESDLRIRTEQVHDLYNNAPCGYHSLDAEGVIVAINDTELRWLGYEREDLVGKVRITELQTPESQRTFKKHFRSFKESGFVQGLEFDFIRSDGSILPVLLSATAVKDDAGNFTMSRSTLFDLSELKKAREALQKVNEELEQRVQERTAELAHSEKEFRTLADNALVGIFRTTLDGKILYANAALIQMLGYASIAELMKEKITTHYKNPSNRMAIVDLLKQTGSLKNHEIELRAKDGERRTVLESVSLEGEILSGMLVDVTDRKQAEEALRAAEKRFRTLIENSSDEISIISADGKLLYESPSKNPTLGYSPGEFLERSLFQLFHPDDLEQAQTYMAQLMQEPKLPIRDQFRLLHRDGSWRWVEGVATNLLAEPSVGGIVINYHDITERKQAEKSEQTKDELLRLTSDMAKVGGWEFDTDTMEGTWTEEVARIHDLDPEEETNVALGLGFYESESRVKIENAIKEAVELGKPYDLELEMTTAKGKKKWVRTMSLPILEGGKVVKVRGIFQDITERVQVEKLKDSIYEIARAAISSMSLDELYPKIHQVLQGLLPAQNFYIALYDQEKDLLSFPYFQDVFDPAPPPSKPGKGLTAYVLRTLKPLLATRETLDDLVRSGEVELFGADSNEWLAVPLTVGDRVIGVMAVQSYKDNRRFGEDDLGVMEYVSTQVASAIERKKELVEKANAEEEIRRLNTDLEARVALRTEELQSALTKTETLYTIARAAVEFDNLPQTLQQFVDRVATTLPANRVILIGFDIPNRKVSHFVRGGPGAAHVQSNVSFNEWMDGLSGWVIREGKATLSPKEEPDPRESAAVRRRRVETRCGSIAVAPLRFLERSLGTLTVINRPEDRDFSEDDLELLEAVANQAAALLTRASLFIEAMEAREEADKANLAKSEFLSRMSHELRTPLNAILGFAQILGMDELSHGQKNNIDHILRAGKHLLGLINEVLDITRIEVGKLSISPESIRLKDVIDETVDLVQAMASRYSVRIEVLFLDEEYVKADRQRLKQVLLNLLTNAIKYNREEGQVFVDCVTLPGDRLQIRVRDTGPGISTENQKRLFVPFERLGAEQSNIEGTGLGLSLSHRLVKALGGSMGVESQLGVGSTFWIELPIVDSPLEQSYHSEDGVFQITPGMKKLQSHNVLYFEDNLSNLQLVEQIFKHRPSIHLMAAPDGKSGLKAARNHLLDLILLDLNLPDIDGYEVLHKLKADPKTRNIPLVIISADATPGQIQRLLDAGAHSYLTKPLDVGEFLQVVDEILENSAIRGK